ncbi:hypothetical protein ACHAWF_000343 [Thalassiosira exigua]
MIKIILHKFPQTPYMPDSIGRYPIHIASSVGVSSEIVNVVAKAYPEACVKQDFDGRTPLHLACDASRLLYEEDSSWDKGHLNRDTIKILLAMAPSSVNIEDVDEVNPIELALLSNADCKILSMLQKVSVSEHRQKHRSSKVAGSGEAGLSWNRWYPGRYSQATMTPPERKRGKFWNMVASGK